MKCIIEKCITMKLYNEHGQSIYVQCIHIYEVINYLLDVVLLIYDFHCKYRKYLLKVYST